MKQHITLDQLQQLDDKGKKILKEWFFNREIEPQLLTIGHMIDFLSPQNSNPYDGGFIDITMDSMNMDRKPNGWVVCDGPWFHSKELCDALWDAVVNRVNNT